MFLFFQWTYSNIEVTYEFSHGLDSGRTSWLQTERVSKTQDPMIDVIHLHLVFIVVA